MNSFKDQCAISLKNWNSKPKHFNFQKFGYWDWERNMPYKLKRWRNKTKGHI